MTYQEKAEAAEKHLEDILADCHDAVLNCYFCSAEELDSVEAVTPQVVWKALHDYCHKVEAYHKW